jgi:hypothetical protein
MLEIADFSIKLRTSIRRGGLIRPQAAGIKY